MGIILVRNTINTSKLVFIFVNNLKVVRYNNPNKVWVISVMFDQRSNIATINLLETLQVSNRFISDSLRESTITQTNYEMYATITQTKFGLSQFQTSFGTTINTSLLVFIFVNNLKVVRYNKSVGN